ncbi:MAG: ParB/RepB/Spo0J family partition protein [Candidatus Sumerlaeia bacterium]|nr:ParB/RepB/Spo0J family partition protein [Candidatus Sumerlaeia bacterium]
MHVKRKALGRGLDALLPTAEPIPVPEAIADVKAVADIDVNLIVPNPYQPRAAISDAALDELAESIRAQGVIQPILVRRVDRKFQLVAGERRWRAAIKAEKTHIPAIIVEPTEQEMLEWALLENVQREDLNAIEEARAYQTLIDEFGLSQEELAVRVGKKRSSVANALRLLKLPPHIQQDIASGTLTAGHGRALLAAEDERQQAHLYQQIMAKNLSVRQAERLATRISRSKPGKAAKKVENDPQLAALIEQLSERVGAKVCVKSKGKTQGRVEIYYSSIDDLDRILSLLCLSAN